VAVFGILNINITEDENCIKNNICFYHLEFARSSFNVFKMSSLSFKIEFVNEITTNQILWFWPCCFGVGFC